jgi:hypothetical protein
VSRDPNPGRTEWDRRHEQDGAEPPSRFAVGVWIGLALLVVALGAIGVYTFRDQLGLVAEPTSTPREFATPLPEPDPTPLPTPAEFAWLWVDCEPNAPCAEELALREEMASYLARALELSPSDTDAFSDIAASPYGGEISALAVVGMTSGCTATEFCPRGHLTREQLATFIQRAFDIPATTRDFFTDDEGSVHESAINAVAAAGVATDCGERLYCPEELVTRTVLAGYLSRTGER